MKYLVFKVVQDTAKAVRVFDDEKSAETYIQSQLTNFGTGTYFIQKVWTSA